MLKIISAQPILLRGCILLVYNCETNFVCSCGPWYRHLWFYYDHLFYWFSFHLQIFATPGLSQHYVHQMALCVKDHTNVLPADISSDFPGYACLLGNLLEAAGVAFTQPGSFDWVKKFSVYFLCYLSFSFCTCSIQWSLWFTGTMNAI